MQVVVSVPDEDTPMLEDEVVLEFKVFNNITDAF